jgi:hypothetical protein
VKYILFLVLFLAGCATTPPRFPGDRNLREANVVLHADVDYTVPSRVLIERSAEKLRVFTGDRAKVKIVYDLNFLDTQGLSDHVRMQHSMLFDVPSDSDVARAIDERHGGVVGSVLAETATSYASGVQRVVFILDRIPMDRLEEVIMHEFGHLVGMKDLPNTGSVMSGWGWSGPNYRSADLTECRRVMLCE